MSMRVLLVEDDLDVAGGIGDYLAAHGLSVDYAGSASQARARVADAAFDLFVLDVNLPDEDGITLCRELKERWGLQQPAIFLTARGGLDDKLQGFAAGAVDYMVKPFAPAELLARIRAIAAYAAAAGGTQLRAGEYALDLHNGMLSRGDRQLQLHAAGFAIMRRLMQAQPGSVSKDALRESLWAREAPESDPLRAHVYQLRQSLRSAFGEVPITTVRGIGYRFGAE